MGGLRQQLARSAGRALAAGKSCGAWKLYKGPGAPKSTPPTWPKATQRVPSAPLAEYKGPKLSADTLKRLVALAGA
jgi:hypothetical protein